MDGWLRILTKHTPGDEKTHEKPVRTLCLWTEI